jgi:hypothetical protein
LDPETQKLQELLEKGIDFDNDQQIYEDNENYPNDEDIDL